MHFSLGAGTILRSLLLCIGLLIGGITAFGQGGPPFYTNDPATPGPFNWEINVGYMPFVYSNNSVSHFCLAFTGRRYQLRNW